jgi:hypothetical protein
MFKIIQDMFTNKYYMGYFENLQWFPIDSMQFETLSEAKEFYNI